MHRRALVIVSLLALLWQCLAPAGASAGGALADAHHVALHWLGQGHHHHDDGSYHDDDSIESTQHLVADNAVGSLAIPCADQSCGVQRAHLAVPAADPSALPQPYLDGLLRPPRARC